MTFAVDGALKANYLSTYLLVTVLCASRETTFFSKLLELKLVNKYVLKVSVVTQYLVAP